jgi:hydrogenase/urease accessory protein HupE
MFVLLAGNAFAHPDHASGSTTGLLHLVTDPYHLLSIGVAVGLAYGASRVLRRLRR